MYFVFIIIIVVIVRAQRCYCARIGLNTKLVFRMFVFRMFVFGMLVWYFLGVSISHEGKIDMKAKITRRKN